MAIVKSNNSTTISKPILLPLSNFAFFCFTKNIGKIGNIIDCQTPYDVGSSYKYIFKGRIEGHGFVIERVNSLIEQVTQFAKFYFIYPFKNMSLSKEQGQTLPKFQY